MTQARRGRDREQRGSAIAGRGSPLPQGASTSWPLPAVMNELMMLTKTP
jgi:hypothetical protein